MMSDLEKFLQQAAQRMRERMEQQQQARPPQAPTPSAQQPAPRSPVQPNKKKKQPNQQAKQRRPDQADQVVEAQLVDDRRAGPNRMSSLDTRAAPISASVHMADERMAGHLHQTFDHQIGQLGSTGPLSSSSNQPSVASDGSRLSAHPIFEALQSPQSLRSAVILSELLQRKHF
jgi:hypothetical protein